MNPYRLNGNNVCPKCFAHQSIGGPHLTYQSSDTTEQMSVRCIVCGFTEFQPILTSDAPVFA